MRIFRPLNLVLPRGSITRQFIVSLFVIILIPIAFIAFFSYTRAVGSLREQLERLIFQVINDVNNSIDRTLESYDWFSLNVSTHSMVRDFMSIYIDDHYQRLVFMNWMNHDVANDFLMESKGIRDIKIIRDDGLMYSASFGVTSDGTGAVDGLTEIRRRLTLEGGSDFFLSFVMSPEAQKMVPRLILARRIYRQFLSPQDGTFILEIDTTDLSRIWEAIEIENTEIWLVDDHGQILFHPDSTLISTDISSILGDISFAENRESFFSDWKNQKTFFVCGVSPYTGWKTIFVTPEKMIREPILSLRRTVVLTTALIFPFSVLLTYLVVTNILRPLQNLKQSMLRTEGGNWHTYDERIPENEIGDLINTYNRMVKTITNLISTVYQTNLDKTREIVNRQRAELQALQNQINPHFLYNTLGAISALVASGEDVETIHQVIEALSSMLRYSVLNSLEPVTLHEELRHLDNFLFIQRTRLNRMPRVMIELSAYTDYPMIRFALQPIVENCFKHAFPEGIEPRHAINIWGEERSEDFVIVIEDNGTGPARPIIREQKAPSIFREEKHIGLTNVHRRLGLVFGEIYGVTVQGRPGAGLTVRIHMPHDGLTMKDHGSI